MTDLSKTISGLILIVILSSCSSKNVSKENQVNSPANATNQQFSVSNGDTIWMKVDKMPVFNGGDEALVEYVKKTIIYPDAAKKSGIQGQVVARFCVGTDATISNISILKGVDSELDRETIRVVNTLHFEAPGYMGSRAVPVWYVLPVTFALN